MKDLTPFPDQDMIHSDVARAPYCTKLNMSNAYEQVQVESDDVKNTAFVMDWLDPLICQLVFVQAFINMPYAALYQVSLCTTVVDKGYNILGIKLI